MTLHAPGCTPFLFPPFSHFTFLRLSPSFMKRQPMKSSGTAPPRCLCSPAVRSQSLGLGHGPEPREVELGFFGRNRGWVEGGPQTCRRSGPALSAPAQTQLPLPSRGRDAGARGHGLPYPMCSESLHEVPIGCGVAIGSAGACAHVAQLP